MRARYRTDPAAQRITAEMDGMTLVYHRPSGVTHLLASPAPEILDVLVAGEADAREVARRLAAAYSLASDDEIELAVEARLSELEAIGLVALS